jgi:hypothetical protein
VPSDIERAALLAFFDALADVVFTKIADSGPKGLSNGVDRLCFADRNQPDIGGSSIRVARRICKPGPDASYIFVELFVIHHHILLIGQLFRNLVIKRQFSEVCGGTSIDGSDKCNCRVIIERPRYHDMHDERY